MNFWYISRIWYEISWWYTYDILIMVMYCCCVLHRRSVEHLISWKLDLYCFINYNFMNFWYIINFWYEISWWNMHALFILVMNHDCRVYTRILKHLLLYRLDLNCYTYAFLRKNSVHFQNLYSNITMIIYVWISIVECRVDVIYTQYRNRSERRSEQDNEDI